jgi:hypothetical protein
LLGILSGLEPGEVEGTSWVGVKIQVHDQYFIYILNLNYNPLIHERPPVAKALNWNGLDGEGRKLGEQPGLDTPLVLAVNFARLVLRFLWETVVL